MQQGHLAVGRVGVLLVDCPQSCSGGPAITQHISTTSLAAQSAEQLTEAILAQLAKNLYSMLSSRPVCQRALQGRSWLQVWAQHSFITLSGA